MTIKDLSAQTGYSVGTISRVLNGHPNVSEKARAAILEAVRESGFELNANAKNLKQQHATSILVMVKGSSNELFRSLLEAIQGRLSKTRYPVSVEYLDEDDNEVLQALRLCREKKPLGILFLGGNTADFRTDFSRIDLPCVLVTRDASELSFGNLSSVSSDDRLAARRGLECLIRLGHRHIAVIGGNMELSDVSRLRYEGCMDAFQAADIVFDPKRDYMGVRFSYQDGYRATQALLSRGRDFSAIFAAADVMAIGAMRALRDNGLRVPEDVSVMGFDGLKLGDYLIPNLSSVAQNVEEMAKDSVSILLDQIENGAEACHELVGVAVKWKESIKALEE